MPVTISGDGGISGLGGLNGYDLETQTLVVSGDTTIAPQSATRATLFCDQSTNTVGINTLAPAAGVFLEVADGTDPIVRVNNTGGGNLDIGSTTSAGYVRGSAGHELRLGSNATDSIVLEADGDVNIDSNSLFVDVSSNRVGIGTNTPGASLEIATAVTAGIPTLYLNRLSNQADTSDIALVGNSVIRGANSVSNVVNTSGYFDWRIGGTDVKAGISNSDSVVRINTNGNVGIGVTSTPGKLCIRRAGSFSSVTYQAATINLNSQLGTYTNGEYVNNIIWARPSSNGGTANAFIGLRSVDNTGAAGALAFGCSTAATVPERMCIDPSGRIYIGTTENITGLGGFNLQIAGNASQSGIAQACYNAAAGGAIHTLYHSRNANINQHTALIENDTMGELRFSGSDGTSTIQSIIIKGQVDGTPTTGTVPGRFTVSTMAVGSTTQTERMRIDNQGKVGFSDYARTSNNVRFANQITGNTSMDSVLNIGAIQPDVTSRVDGFKTYLISAAGSYTTNEINHFSATHGAFGAGHTVTTQHGFYVPNSFTGATNNFGFYSNIPANTGRWNFFANGTADNYFAGKVLIGGTTLPEVGGATNTKLLVQDASGSRIVIRRYNSDSAGGQLYFAKSGNTSTPDNTLVPADSEIGKIAYYGADGNDLNTEAVRIVGSVDGTASNNNVPGRVQIYIKPDGGVIREVFRITEGGSARFGIGSTGDQPSSTNRGCWINYDGHILTSRGVDGTGVVIHVWGNAGEARIYGDGDLENTNNRYTGISDLKLKENITDANSQWDDIKALRLVNFNFKEETKMSTHRQLGLVAQEVEKVSPGLVQEREEHKSVSYSVVYLKAVKALQEAMARIEALESEVSALKSNQVN